MSGWEFYRAGRALHRTCSGHEFEGRRGDKGRRDLMPIAGSEVAQSTWAEETEMNKLPCEYRYHVTGRNISTLLTLS